MDPNANPENQGPAALNAAIREWRLTRELIMAGQMADFDGILAWVLYSLAAACLAAGDKDSVQQILEILRPIDDNLAELLISKLGKGR